ncbi:MAG: CRISPR-associated endonuclease Cas1 [Planctomycetota bacterium]
MNPLLFRFRVVLQLKKNVQLHAMHSGVLHALLCAAWGSGNGVDPVMPDGVWLDATEQCRIQISKGERYSFGLTSIDPSPALANDRIQKLISGFKRVGRSRPPAKTVLGGNYDLIRIEDLVAGKTLSPNQIPQPIPQSHLNREFVKVADEDRLTLRFVSPLLAERPVRKRTEGHQFFDRHWFGVISFLNRLQLRLSELGFQMPKTSGHPSRLKVARNELVWLDFTYGRRDRRKAKHGAMGRICFEGLTPDWITHLVVGQYTRVGGATRFGLGNYRIEELGDDPFRCRRSRSLLEMAISEIRVDQNAESAGLPSGFARQSVHEIRHGNYQPDPHFVVQVGEKSGKQRTLTIPSRKDRVLQKCVLDVIAPALDKFFEESSLAYRKGLGVQRAAARLRTAVRLGYEWALKADFREFFDSIDHRELKQRIQAYLGDDELADLIQLWIKAGSPTPNCGVPTGAPISPVISNLFLDVFDEAVEKSGGFLVRYADDFLILYRTQAEAVASHDKARQVAQSLCLALNENKTGVLDLKVPFEFLGFQFLFRERWEVSDSVQPIRIRDLGWKKKSKPTDRPEWTPLPGESQIGDDHHESTIICGPHVGRIDSQGNQLLVHFKDGKPVRSIPLGRTGELVLIGAPDITGNATKAMTRHQISWYLVTEFGKPLGSFVVNDPVDSHRAIIAQAETSVSPRRCLEISKHLVQSKLQNYAALARSSPGKFRDWKTSKVLMDFAAKVGHAQSIAEVIGIEGAGAARWYGNLSGRLAGGFRFEKRISPDAWDPVNALLNAGQTMLHHYIVQIIQLVGLAPAVGLMHTARSGHSSLASDMQEPFRHLIDRTVLESLKRIRKDDFHVDNRGKYPLTIKPRAMKLLIKNFHWLLTIKSQSVDQSLAKSYRMQIVGQVRSLKRSMMDWENRKFESFRHPS